VIFVQKNSSIHQIAEDLKKNDLIHYIQFFKFPLQLQMKWKKLKYISYGEYFISFKDTRWIILNRLLEQKIMYRFIRFSEGMTNDSIFKLLEKNEFLTGSSDIKDNWEEGSLLPDTYSFRRGDNRNTLLHTMQKNMDNFLNISWQEINSNLLLKSKRDLLILASIVEKESRTFEEKKLVASVFLNRLRLGMPLQSDPTAIYAYSRGNIDREKDIPTNFLIRKKLPHNTYLIKGLPPTPICNPSRESIRAVVQAPITDYLFFLGGIPDREGLVFTKNYQEHLQLVKLLRQHIKNKTRNTF
jgi:UPF0755 protein